MPRARATPKHTSHNITQYSGHRSQIQIRSIQVTVAWLYVAGYAWHELSGLGYIFENREMAERGKVSHKLQQSIIKGYAIYKLKFIKVMRERERERESE